MTKVKNPSFSVDQGEIEFILKEAGRSADLPLKLLEKDRLDLSDFCRLITADESDGTFFESLARRAREVTIRRFGMVKGFYIPLYISSVCNNACSYCGFSRTNTEVKRKNLSMDEIRAELSFLYERGFRHLLLVSGEVEGWGNMRFLAGAAAAARETGFHSIAVEYGALDGVGLRQISEAGAQSFVLYQETYHPQTYAQVHLSGRKTDFEWRLSGAERAIDAGFRQVTLGFLAGLHDPLFEAAALYKHLLHLKKCYWGTELSVSIPRLTRAAGAGNGFRKVTDRKFAQIAMALRLAFPEVCMNLSTREQARFRDGLANICATHLSVESKTHPGGYAEGGEELVDQFEVRDARSMAEVAEALSRMGYDVYLKDWEAELNRV